ncbi:MAG TPA: glycosyltransferase [Nitrospirota bacterium]|nr:glycosyltransferase [Nitrospirota bacterium]
MRLASGTGTIASRKELCKELECIVSADILVGIPSFNNARTIGHVVRAVQAGLAKYFPDRKAVLIDSDGGSTDGTADIVQNTVIENFKSILLHHRVEPAFKMSIPYHGLPGKGSAFRAIFEIAEALQVKACAVVDSDLRSITPEWVELLIKPVLESEVDYVAPLYRRHKYDGTITNSIIHPLTRALYGKRVRQPIGGDFGFSGKLARHYLSKDVWNTDVARYGIDIWMTTEAIANNFKVAEAFLGAKIHDPKDPGADLSAMLYQVVGSAFGLMESYDKVWKTTRGSEAPASFGFQYEVGLEQVPVDAGRMLRMFRAGVKSLKEIWVAVLGQGDFSALESLSECPDEEFRFPLSLWARVVYDYALAYHMRKLPHEHLLRSLTPLYLGKTASFVMEVRDRNQSEAEAEIEKLCLEFEAGKDYLVNNWK